MIDLKLNINGEQIRKSVPDQTMLVDLIRVDLALTGTHVGCDSSQCGACLVQVDGVTTKSCTILAAQANGCEITTIEAIGGAPSKLNYLQAAFREHHGLQCGFCTPGMIMAGMDIIERHGSTLTEEIVRSELSGNICRCTGYTNIVKAILDAAENQNVEA